MFRCMLILSLSLLGSPAIAQLCTGFRGGSLSDQALKQEYAPSIFTVGEVGTAYLIDAKQGYLVTANHVLIDLAVAKKPLEVWVSTPDSSSHKAFPFVISSHDDELDIALLKIERPDPSTKKPGVPEAIQKLRPLDIASDVPDSDTHLFVMGYPAYGGQSTVFLRGGGARFNSLTRGGMIEVEQLTEGGNSGGPLLNGNGYVLGTCEQQSEQSKIGRYLPMVRMLSLFSDIPVSDRMLDLEDKLTRKELDEDALKQFLAHSSAGATNLEFYLWVKRVAASPALMATVRPHLRCPIVPALLERGMLEALYLLYPETEKSEKVQISLALGDREYKLGHDSTALEYAKKASALATSEERETKILALLLQGRAEERMNLIAEARKSYLLAVKTAGPPPPWSSLGTSVASVTEEGGVADLLEPWSLWAQATAAEARAAAKLGRINEAYRGFQQAEKFYAHVGDRREQYDTNLDMARLKLRSGDYPGAEPLIREAIEAAPDNDLAAAAWYQLGAIQLHQRNKSGALASYRQVVELAPKSQSAADAQQVIDAQSRELPKASPPPRPPR